MQQFCCIKWGYKYGPEYVNRLCAGIARHFSGSFDLICLTDDASGISGNVTIRTLERQPFDDAVERNLSKSRRKGAFRKVALFNPEIYAKPDADVVGFDLDVVITGELNSLVSFEPGRVSMRHDWLERRRGRNGGHGSVFKFTPQRHNYLYRELIENTDELMAEAKYSEQKFTSNVSQRYGDFRYLPNDWICSFKRDAMRIPPLNHLLAPKLPPESRVMCFHGRPTIEEALVGYKGGVLRSTIPAQWIADNWLD